MQTDGLHKRHPSQHELMLHAEALFDGKAAPNAHVTVHVAKCPVCASEVKAISASLKMIIAAPAIEPSLKSQTALMMRVRKDRRTRKRLQTGGRSVVRVARGMAYAAAIILVAALAFGAALSNTAPSSSTPAINAVSATLAENTSPARSGYTMDENFATVRTLSNAVQRPGLAPLSLENQEQRRAVNALGADLAAAQEALNRNPGCERASAVMNASLEQQAETLRDLYVRGSL